MNGVIKRRNLSVDILKTFAIFSVFLYHYNPKLFPSGFLGVEVFLLVTGYLSYLGLQSKSTIGFLKERFIRVYPSLLFQLIFFLLVLLIISTPTELYTNVKLALSSVIFLSNIYLLITDADYFSNMRSLIFLQNWSIALEFQVWIFLALLTSLISKLKQKIEIILICLVILLVYPLYLIIESKYIEEYFNPLRLIGLSFTGYYLASLQKRFLVYLNSYLLIFLFLVSFYLIFFSFDIYNFILVIIFSVLILFLDLHSNRFSMFFFRWFSDHTYGIYLFHYPLLVIFRDYYDLYYSLILTLGFTILFSIISKEYFEKSNRKKSEH